MNLFKLTVLLVYIVPLRSDIFGEAKSYPYDSSDDYAPRRGRASHSAEHLVSVDIRDRFSTRELDYRYDRATGRHTFSTKPPYLIDAVTRGGRTLWDAAEHGHEYGSEVVFGTDRRTNKSIFRVYFPGESSARYHDLSRGDSYRGDRYGRDYYRYDSYRRDPYRYDRRKYDSFSEDGYGDDRYGYYGRYGRGRYRDDYYGDYRYGRDPYRGDRYGRDRYRRDSFSDDRYALDRYGSDRYGRGYYGRYGRGDYRLDRYGPYDYGDDYYGSRYPYGSRYYDSHRLHSRYPRDYYGQVGLYGYGPHYGLHAQTNLVTLNTNNRHSSNVVQYHFDPLNRAHTFRAVWPNLFRLVKRGERVLWEPGRPHGPFPDTVYLFPRRGGRFALRVAYPAERWPEPHRRHDLGLAHRLDPNYKYHLQLARPDVHPHRLLVHGRFLPHAAQPKLTDRGTSARLLQLDIDLSYTNPLYTYSEHNYIGTFAPCHDYLFREVGESHMYPYDFNLIWRAQDYRELCFKVLVCPPYVTLFLLDGTRLVFKKREFGWELYDRVLDATNTLDLDYKLIDIDINDRKSAHTHEVRQDHVYSPDQEVYSFLPRFDYKIKSLRDGETTFWRANGGHDAAFRVFVSRFHFPDIISVVVSTVDGAKRTFSKKLDSLLKSKWSELTPSSPNITAGKITR